MYILHTINVCYRQNANLQIKLILYKQEKKTPESGVSKNDCKYTNKDSDKLFNGSVHVVYIHFF